MKVTFILKTKELISRDIFSAREKLQRYKTSVKSKSTFFTPIWIGFRICWTQGKMCVASGAENMRCGALSLLMLPLLHILAFTIWCLQRRSGRRPWTAACSRTTATATWGNTCKRSSHVFNLPSNRDHQLWRSRIGCTLWSESYVSLRGRLNKQVANLVRLLK